MLPRTIIPIANLLLAGIALGVGWRLFGLFGNLPFGKLQPSDTLLLFAPTLFFLLPLSIARHSRWGAAAALWCLATAPLLGTANFLVMVGLMMLTRVEAVAYLVIALWIVPTVALLRHRPAPADPSRSAPWPTEDRNAASFVIVVGFAVLLAQFIPIGSSLIDLLIAGNHPLGRNNAFGGYWHVVVTHVIALAVAGVGVRAAQLGSRLPRAIPGVDALLVGIVLHAVYWSIMPFREYGFDQRLLLLLLNTTSKVFLVIGSVRVLVAALPRLVPNMRSAARAPAAPD